MWKQMKVATLLMVLQTIFIVLFAVFVEYDSSADASIKPTNDDSQEDTGPVLDKVATYYGLFQDVHVMIFFGIGFLLTFMKRYSHSSVGLNFLIGAIVAQWAAFMQGFHAGNYTTIKLDVVSMLGADISAATVLISFCAVLGKISEMQLIIMAIIETVIFTSNEHLGLHVFKVADIGGSIFVHVFAAYFGIGVAIMLYRKAQRDHPKNGPTYISDIFSMAGTLFLWLFWPSFNAALATGADRHRAMINTYFAMCACCMTTFATSAFIRKGKFDMVHVQNATLAGGVAIGSTADLMVQPFGALLIGSSAGILSTVGFAYISPFLESRCKILDTCGVNNLHGLPGIMAGLIGALMSYLASEEQYGKRLYHLYPARIPESNTTLFNEISDQLGPIEPGLGRTAADQAIYQLIALGVTIVISFLGGILTGAILRIPIFDSVDDEDLYDDSIRWEQNEEEFDLNLKDSNNMHFPLEETSKM